MRVRVAVPLVVFVWLPMAAAAGQAPAPAPTSAQPSEPPKLRVSIDLAAAAIHDNSLSASRGREQQFKVPYAIAALFGDLNPHVSYRVEFNGVNDSVTPEPFIPSDKTPYFFPNQADPAYGVSSKPEGLWKVDDYKNSGWDPYIQENALRRAFVDLHMAGARRGIVIGRFFTPIGLPLEQMRWYTAKDITHIQSINAVVDTGLELYGVFGKPEGVEYHFELAAVTGNGNPYHDYAYADFSRSSFEDTNSALSGVGRAGVRVAKALQASVTYQYNRIGSRIERDTTLQRSKHYDDKLIVSGRYRVPVTAAAEVFGEYARYKWGMTASSAELMNLPNMLTPVIKQGFYLGADVGTPVQPDRLRVGALVTYERLDRDDSLIALLAATGQLGVRLGETEHGTILKIYVEKDALSAFFFVNDEHNPFPQVSAIVAISGPSAYQGYGDRKIGGGIRFRPSF